MNRHLLSFTLSFLLSLTGSAQYWKLTGNADATNTSKLGTLNAFPLRFYTKSLERMQIDSQGRVTVGANSSSSSALFEVASTNRGVLIPRMTQAQRNAIWMPAQGLLVYQTDGTRGFYYYDGGWKPIAPPAGSTSGFANTMLSNLVPTAINQDLVADGDNTRSLGSSSKGWQNLYLTSSVYLGGQRFLSGPGDNTFTGRGAGVSTTGTGNTANGHQALYNNTSGTNNAAVGYLSLYSNTTGTNNTAHGYVSLYSNTTGSSNSAVGDFSLYSNTSGRGNIAVGESALYNNTSGSNNTALGNYSLNSNTTGFGNTAQGFSALSSNTTGGSNIAVGYQSLISNTTGSDNIAIGVQAMLGNTTGGGNVAMGGNSMRSNTTGQYNTAQGYQSLLSNTTGSSNTAVGNATLYQNTTGGSNTAVGDAALFQNTTGGSNTAVGVAALSSNTTGSNNIAIGLQSLKSNTEGASNTAVGSQSLYSNTTGVSNTANGYQSLLNNTSGNDNTAVGNAALQNNNTGNNNTAQGFQSLYSNTTGSNNAAHGFNALYSNTTGIFNTANGHQSLFSNTTGNSNAAHGFQSLFSNTTGEGNTAQGLEALLNNTTGSYNTALGYNSLFYTTSNYITGVGFHAGYNCSTCTTATFLGANANTLDGLDNVTAVGSGAQTLTPNNVTLGNTAVLTVTSTGVYVQTSDGRFKRDLKEEVPGLEFINKLRPVTYHYKIHELNSHIKQESKALPKAGGMETMKGMKGMDGMKGIEPPKADERVAAAAKAKEEESIRAKEAIKYTGFVAQEVEEAAKKVNYDFSGVHKPTGSKDVYGLSYAEFVVPLVKAVQELSKENKELKERLDKLEALVTGATLTNPASSTSLALTSAYLEQSTPNPSNGSATIGYYVPNTAGNAKLVFADMKGSVLKTMNLSKGKGRVVINNAALAAGSYTYTLYVDNAQVDSKQMVVGR